MVFSASSAFLSSSFLEGTLRSEKPRFTLSLKKPNRASKKVLTFLNRFLKKSRMEGASSLPSVFSFFSPFSPEP